MRTAARALLPRAQPGPGTDLSWVLGGKWTEPDHMAEPERAARGQGEEAQRTESGGSRLVLCWDLPHESWHLVLWSWDSICPALSPG